MFRPIDYLRRHVYPRGRLWQSSVSGHPRGSDAMLGMMIVMLAVLGVAYATELALF
jgi:hypothetical protein